MRPELRLLRDLVALPSVNPAFLPAGDPFAGERSVAEFMAATAAQAGLDVEFQDVCPQRPNVLVVLRPVRPPKQRILLVPHLDTVGVDGAERFDPQVRNRRLHGRGACDTKGSAAAMLCALIRVARRRIRPRETEVVLAGVVDEENNQAGSRALAKSGLKADLGIVGEPTQLRVVTAHKGNVWLQVQSRGRAAHGCRPELGRNAIQAMARVVELLEGTYATGLKTRQHPLLGHPTVNVGTIHGGTQPNIVPEQCVISIDRRTLPGETDSTVQRELRSLLRQWGVQARVTFVRGFPCPAMETSPELPLVKQLMRVVRQRQPRGVPYFCDAAVLASGGVPSVVFGPGNIAQAHTRDEWIALDQLQQATEILEHFLGALP